MRLLEDALKKTGGAHSDHSLLQWGFWCPDPNKPEFKWPTHSHQLPNTVIDLILKWRDTAYQEKTTT